MCTILIADDSSFMRTMIRRILEKEGFQIAAEAENGIVCIEKYKEYRPEIVILDITMPEMDGIRTLSELREIDPKVKAVIVSAMGQEAFIQEAISIGAESFIVKPFKTDHILAELRRTIAR